MGFDYNEFLKRPKKHAKDPEALIGLVACVLGFVGYLMPIIFVSNWNSSFSKFVLEWSDSVICNVLFPADYYFSVLMFAPFVSLFALLFDIHILHVYTVAADLAVIPAAAETANLWTTSVRIR